MSKSHLQLGHFAGSGRSLGWIDLNQGQLSSDEALKMTTDSCQSSTQREAALVKLKLLRDVHAAL